LRELQAVSL